MNSDFLSQSGVEAITIIRECEMTAHTEMCFVYFVVIVVKWRAVNKCKSAANSLYSSKSEHKLITTMLLLQILHVCI